jgi:hypothetical protein
MGQNRNRKSSSSDTNRGSFLSRPRPDAPVALQQSLILPNDMDKVPEMNYNGKCEVKSLRPFTQLNEQTLSIKSPSFENYYYI